MTMIISLSSIFKLLLSFSFLHFGIVHPMLFKVTREILVSSQFNPYGSTLWNHCLSCFSCCTPYALMPYFGLLPPIIAPVFFYFILPPTASCYFAHAIFICFVFFFTVFPICVETSDISK